MMGVSYCYTCLFVNYSNKAEYFYVTSYDALVKFYFSLIMLQKKIIIVTSPFASSVLK